jgi:hypothetical protein
LKSFKEFYEESEISIEEFLIKKRLTESFDIKQTEYGTNFPDFDNKRFNAYGSTYFNYSSKIIEVIITSSDKSNEIIFKFFTGDKVKNKEDLDTTSEPIYGNNALAFFNRAIYILFDYLKNNENINSVIFEGDNKKLQKVYKTMTKNRIVLSKFNNLGWSYQGESNHKHRFIKIN